MRGYCILSKALSPRGFVFGSFIRITFIGCVYYEPAFHPRDETLIITWITFDVLLFSWPLFCEIFASLFIRMLVSPSLLAVSSPAVSRVDAGLGGGIPSFSDQLNSFRRIFQLSSLFYSLVGIRRNGLILDSLVGKLANCAIISRPVIDLFRD